MFMGRDLTIVTRDLRTLIYLLNLELFFLFFFLFMKFVHGTGRNQIAIKLIRWRLHSIASYIKTVRKNR